jgi:membrane protein YdbS with pleckstrin-like domain
MQFPEEEVVPRNANGINLFINEGTLIIDFFFIDITRSAIETDEGPMRQGYLISRVSLSAPIAEKLKKQIDRSIKILKNAEEGNNA